MRVDVAESPNVLSVVDAATRWRSAHPLGAYQGEVRYDRGSLSIVDKAIFSGTSFVTAVIVGRAASRPTCWACIT